MKDSDFVLIVTAFTSVHQHVTVRTSSKSPYLLLKAIDSFTTAAGRTRIGTGRGTATRSEAEQAASAPMASIMECYKLALGNLRRPNLIS